MCIFAHPDDESMGTGGMLAKYAAEGVETYVVCATGGEYGWPGDRPGNPGPEALARIRLGELQAACAVLGVREVIPLGYVDGALDQADPAEVIARLAEQLRRVRPHVVVTFGPDGIYGHPDHIAISQLALAAVVCAGSTDAAGAPPHRVAKVYYFVGSQSLMALFGQLLGGEFSIEVDGVTRREVAWQDWAITTRIDAAAYWEQAWQALRCHQTQIVEIEAAFAAAPPELHRQIWGEQPFYRVYSLVNGGRRCETDLFAGLRIEGSSTTSYHKEER
jgi:LmbE family N-acetylglucosaminyl deacetylase